MKKLTLITLTALNLALSGAWGAETKEPAPAPPIKPVPEKPARRFDFQWPGGPLGNLVVELDHASKEPFNLLVPQEVKSASFPQFLLRNITIDELFEALNLMMTRNNPIRFQQAGRPDQRIWVAQTRETQEAPRESGVFFVGDILQKNKIEDVTTAIRTAWEMSTPGRQGIAPQGQRGEGAPSHSQQLKFHKETQLLIASASRLELDLVSRLLEELRKGLSADNPVPAAKAEKPAQTR
mgnify:CR=1 FL=1